MLKSPLPKNRGVILGQRNTDWQAGAISGIEYKELNPSGDWTQWLPKEEWQWKDNGFDTLACVTFSALNIIESLYYFHTGRQVNFSDRYTAFMSGTTPNGNWQWKVGDSIRKDGLALEQDWPMIDNPSWDTYYTAPPIEVINKAKDFLKDWQVNYEFIDFTKESLIKHLKQAPIQVVFPNHAVMLFATTEQVYRYFDSYLPFIKERSEGFITAMKLVLTKKTMKLKLVREKNRNAVYAIISGKYYWISAEAMGDLTGEGLASWEDVVETEIKIELDGVIK
ncbi:MAG: hypothetical protein UT43_C0001G0014 [Parcubacteria group bacterium GW2011_GWC1_39_29]|uniref:Uncharacterized protein n=1 Tax=Candidatus Yanofskybacteria bacterium GW2011_GWD1_39_16 TaxID=1619030 RepID=A0A837I060_9BACT|nr:MAG: hypothetical protein UT35_C0004G0007 [Candidatus Yanofskybacteria bacterium GW2011_GWD1_39_16]KKR15391.1 MAG: hypothetical protein UT43_C0001G0014 [Parcubacteria group bacterium GW2011_GWC1_39_29]